MSAVPPPDPFDERIEFGDSEGRSLQGITGPGEGQRIRIEAEDGVIEGTVAETEYYDWDQGPLFLRHAHLDFYLDRIVEPAEHHEHALELGDRSPIGGLHRIGMCDEDRASMWVTIGAPEPSDGVFRKYGGTLSIEPVEEEDTEN